MFTFILNLNYPIAFLLLFSTQNKTNGWLGSRRLSLLIDVSSID